MNWIKERLNRDNFWNLMFWLGMSFGLAISFSLKEFNQNLSWGLGWTTLLLVPYIVKRGSRVTFNEDENFLNSKGEILNKRIPNMFLLCLTTFTFLAFIGSVLDKDFKDLSKNASFFIVHLCIFFAIIVNFIYKNCPISILFNKNFWKVEPNTRPYQSYDSSSSHQFSNSTSYESPITSTRYSGCSWNVHNSNYHNR